MLKRKNSESDENGAKRAAVELSLSSPVQGSSVREDSMNDQEVQGSTADNSSVIVSAESSQSTSRAKPNIVSSHKLNVEVDPSTFIHIRILVTLKEAVVIIGKGGSTITKIREASGIRLNVSDHVPGITERVVNLKGSAEHVSKAAGLIVRTLNNEVFDSPSSPDAKSYNLRVLIPHVMMGAMIGKGGSRFREIEEASAAKLKAQEYTLPSSTDRILFVLGVADAVHIAVYYICTTYISHKEYLGNFKPTFYNPATAAQQQQQQHMQGSYYGGPVPGYEHPYGSGGPGGPMPYGGHGNHGGPGRSGSAGGPNSFAPPLHYHSGPPMQVQPYNTSGSSRYANRIHLGTGTAPPRRNLSSNPGLNRGHMEAQAAPRNQELFQDVYIPNEYVGSIIGKGGAKIKDIRHLSGSRVKINDPIPNGTERLISIWGTPESNETAIYLIHSLIESEKKRNPNPRSNNFNGSQSTQSSQGGNQSGNQSSQGGQDGTENSGSGAAGSSGPSES